ncbi:sialate O-acetylesterase [Aureliella helgolandensis]|nr:sialate O-acetylesterase [Aureliella helgolandensis]
MKLWIEGGKIYGRARRNGVDLWELSTDAATYADAKWHRVAMSGGVAGPQLWVDGELAVATFGTGSSSNTEWTSNVNDNSVTFRPNRICIGAARIGGVNESNFVGRLRNPLMSSTAATAEVMLTDKRDNAQPYDVMVNFGQSNEIGRGLGIDGTLDATDVRIQQWGRNSPNDNKIFLAADPLEHVGATADSVGPGMSTAKEWIRRKLEPGRRVLIVPVAEGNTGFRDDKWNVSNTNRYHGMVTRTGLALDECSESRIVACFCQLGERDAGGNTAEGKAFTAEFREMIGAFREEFPNESFPVVIGTMPKTWVDEEVRYKEVQQQILAMQDTIPNCIVVDATDLPSRVEAGGGAETIHYSVESARTLGTRRGAALADYWTNPSDYFIRTPALSASTQAALAAEKAVAASSSVDALGRRLGNKGSIFKSKTL